MSDEENFDEKLQKLVDERVESLREDLKEEAREEARQEIEKLKTGESVQREDDASAKKGLSRREFLKKAGLGTAGLAALGFSPANALNINSDSFSVQTSSDGGSTLSEGLFVDQNQNVKISNGNLDLDGNDLVNVGQMNSSDADSVTITKSVSTYGELPIPASGREFYYVSNEEDIAVPTDSDLQTWRSISDFDIVASYIPLGEILYNFEDEKSGEATDTSSNSNTGTFVGSPTYTADSAYKGLALSTDSGSGINCPDLGIIRPQQDWSMVLFFKDSDLAGSSQRFYWSGRANYDIKLVYRNSDGTLNFNYYKGGDASTDGTAVSNDTWHMVVLRNDYTNGVRKISVDTVDYGTSNDFSAESRSYSNNVGYADGNGNNSVDIDGYFLYDYVIDKEVEEKIYNNSNLP